jgi:hypothetical protein
VRDAIATYSRIKRLPRHQEQGPQESSWPGSGVAQGREESFEFRVSSGRSPQQQRWHSSRGLSGLYASTAANEIIITRSTDYILCTSEQGSLVTCINFTIAIADLAEHK